MRRLRRLVRYVFVERRSLAAAVVLSVASIVLAYATGFWLVSRLGNLLLAALPLAFLWSRLNLRGLEVKVEQPVDRLQAGGHYEERITLTNRSWFTKLWLEVEQLSDLPGHHPRRVFSLGPRATRSWRAVTPCERRGLYTVGPVRIASGDLFGLFRHERTFGGQRHVLVYPNAQPLSGVAVPPALLPGEGTVRRPTQQITPNAASVRPYQPGDSYNRIHWRSTARLGEPMVKLFELDPASDVWVVLDLYRPSQAGEGDDGTEEHAVVIAASLARHFLLANRSVGFLALGRSLHLQEPERGLAQYTRVLEALALVRAEGDVSLAELLNHEGRRFGRRTTVLAITPSTDDSWVTSLQMLAGRGVKPAAVLLEARTYGGFGNTLLVYGALAAADVPTYLVKRGDTLASALGGGAAFALAGGAP